MQLHCDPISTTSRPILMFLAEHEAPVEIVHVSLMAGEHQSEAFACLNRNRAVPVLTDGDFVLTESSAILKYLAEALDSPTYPTERRARALVNSAMDWFNTGLSHDLNYAFVYPQIFPQMRFEPEAAQAAVLERGLANAKKRLDVLDYQLADRDFVCGNDISIADYIGAGYVGLSEAIDFDLSPWPNVEAWMFGMRRRPSWQESHAAFYGLIAAHRTPVAAE
ncbi:MAG TPA: glutathione S-transferase family protein [Caulobacteraceae bacterium]|nr:glutathione S-transferase family protein [Caulobacteraceae bacterium]